MYVYLTQQLRCSLVRLGQSFTSGALTSGSFECSHEYGCCVISVGSCETSVEILLWTFNQTFMRNIPVLSPNRFIKDQHSIGHGDSAHTCSVCG